MEQHAFLIINTAIIIECLIMGFVFLALPLPANKGLNKYRNSLRFLAGAYFILSFLKIIVVLYDIAIVDLISVEGLTISSLQAPLFTFTLIALINPNLVTKKYLFTILSPIPILLIIYILVAIRWGNPRIMNFSELREILLHPAVIIREIYCLYYLYLLIYLTIIFNKEIHSYEKEIDNYYADNYRLYLPGIRYSFYAALSIGIGAMVSCFMFSELWVLIFTISYGIFYFVFGIYYIQYPRTFVYIQGAINLRKEAIEELGKPNKRLIWKDLKTEIINTKYYLKTGVNIEEMSQHLKIGRTTLSTFINNEEGMNFNMWINTLRIEESKKILIEFPDYNLAQISEMVGYSESSNFSRQFKQITKVSPSVWRQKHRNKQKL
ncbi:MAG: helix-turn-helix transcriptional regulator [Paludibacter sp.]|nr:helix-turn-helix transcriptional regulator [Paludibacter sp.]